MIRPPPSRRSTPSRPLPLARLGGPAPLRCSRHGGPSFSRSRRPLVTPGSCPTFPEARAALALSMIRGVGSATFRQLVATFGSATRALDDPAHAQVRSVALAAADAAVRRATE